VLYALPQPTDRKLSRQAAEVVAGLLGSKVVSDRQIVIGEPQCHYAVRLNTEHFWFGARFSPSIYVTGGTHKRIGNAVVPFFASLKMPDRRMLADTLLPRASAELRIPVFVSEIGHGPIASEILCSAEVRERIGELDFQTIRTFLISPMQIRVIGQFSDASKAAIQIMVQRDLLESIYRRAMPPNTALERTRGR